MRITTKGIKKEVITPKEIKEAAKFFFSKLGMHPKLLSNLDVQIIMTDKILCKGDMEWLDRPVKPREFRIRLNNRFKKRQTLLTLAHEIVHVKQYATGELTDETMRYGVRWNKTDVDEREINYWDLPYEIEARGREEGLYYRYLQTLPGVTVTFFDA